MDLYSEMAKLFMNRGQMSTQSSLSQIDMKSGGDKH